MSSLSSLSSALLYMLQGDISLPDNLDSELDRLRDESDKLIQDLADKQSGKGKTRKT